MPADRRDVRFFAEESLPVAQLPHKMRWFHTRLGSTRELLSTRDFLGAEDRVRLNDIGESLAHPGAEDEIRTRDHPHLGKMA
jgi:hypothetical protein